MTAHSARATPALQALTETDPALAALSLWCHHRDMPEGLAETRGDSILYGPDFPRLPLHQATGLAGHHILHVALRHTARMAAMRDRLGERFDARLWGIAADAIVNEALLLAGHALPRPALRLTGLLSATLGEAEGRAALAEWDVERLYLRLAPGAGGDDGLAQAARAHAAAQGHAPDLHPAPDPQSDGTAEDPDWQAHMARAVQAGRMAGRGIGTLGRDFADLPVPRLPWEIVLRGALARALIPRAAPHPLRPARRWLAQSDDARRRALPDPAFTPGTTRLSAAPRVALALDMSGSVGEAQLALFLAEISGAAARAAAELWLIPFDDSADKPLRLPPGPLHLQSLPLRHGGGTSLHAPLAAAARLNPSLAVFLTDLQADLPPAPRFPLIWAVPDATDVAPPPFGTLIDLSR